MRCVRHDLWPGIFWVVVIAFGWLSGHERWGTDAGPGDELSLVAAGFFPLAAVEISAEERRRRELFLKARGLLPAEPTPPPRPEETPAIRATPAPTPSEKPQATPRTTPRPTPRPTPTSERAPQQPKFYRGVLISTPTPAPTPAPTPPPVRSDTARTSKRPDEVQTETAPVVVQKSGLSRDEGLAEPPPERKEEPNFFQRVFGGRSKSYKYLTPSVRSRINDARVRKGRWKYIIVHNSGSAQGNATIFEHYHKNVRKMQNGLAYHFVIGNGTKSGNGEIEIGARWDRQINGGHVASDYLNNIAIGICLVGDFNKTEPTQAQIEALEELVTYLRRRVGKVEGRPSIVKAHKEINPRPTDCPGDRFPYRWLHRRFD